MAWFEFVNKGNSTWGLNETRLGTQDPQDRPSAFFVDGNWLSPARPTGADHSNYGPGSVGRFTFAIKAPEVTEPTTFTETFQLLQEGQAWFGPKVTMTITVAPRPGAGGGGEPSPDPEPDPEAPPSDPPGEEDPTHGGMGGGCAVGGGPGGGRALGTWALALGCAMLLSGARRRPRRRP